MTTAEMFAAYTLTLYQFCAVNQTTNQWIATMMVNIENINSQNLMMNISAT